MTVFNPVPYIAEQILVGFNSNLTDPDIPTLEGCWQEAEAWARKKNDNEGFLVERPGSMGSIRRTTGLYLDEKELQEALALAMQYEVQRRMKADLG